VNLCRPVNLSPRWLTLTPSPPLGESVSVGAGEGGCQEVDSFGIIMKDFTASKFSCWLVLLCFSVCCGSGFAAPKPWTLDALMDLKTVDDPQITADGSKVAFVVHRVNSSRNAYDSEIWTIQVTGGTPSRLVSPHFTDTWPRWSGDGKGLAFLSRRSGSAQVYLADQIDKEPGRLTDSRSGVTYFSGLRTIG
jgi:hypothetical protein